MKGFNYITHTEFDLPVAELRTQLKAACDDGGFRRVESDSLGAVTYAHGSDGKLIWEAYGNINMKNGQETLI